MDIDIIDIIVKCLCSCSFWVTNRRGLVCRCCWRHHHSCDKGLAQGYRFREIWVLGIGFIEGLGL